MTAVITGSAFVRTVQSGDRTALERFFGRCSQLTVYRRFFAPLRRFPAGYLDAVLDATPGLHDAAVVRSEEGADIVGLASFAVAPDTSHTGELGVMVADAWQGRGLGEAMTGHLIERANRRGVQRLSASVLPDRAVLLRALARRLEITAVVRKQDAVTGIYRIG